MRAALLLLTMLALAGAGYWALQGAGASPPPVVDDGPPGDAPAKGAPAGSLPPGVVATRTEAVDIDPGQLADAPTVCLRVLDQRTGTPIEGALVRRLQSGADLSFSDARGLALVPLEEAAQLAVVKEGYLMRLAPARLGSDEARPQIVRLLPDTWSTVRRFLFVGPDGEPVDALVRLRPAGSAAPRDNGRAAAKDPVAARAWSEHLMMAGREVSRDQNLHAGARDEHVYRTEAEVLTVLFCADGDYRIEAATTSGLVGEASVTVAAGPQPPVQVVKMAAGAAVAGVVVDPAGGAIAGAQLTVQGGDPLGLRATTDAAGAFSIGPLVEGACTLTVRHAVHEPAVLQGVQVPCTDRRVVLTPLPRTPLRCLVRARPGLEPIADATVVWQVAGGGAVTARTDADGRFELQAAGSIAARLVVQAQRFLTYAELVDPGAPFAHYDLLPAGTSPRIAAGLTATLEGVVYGQDGLPLANASVRWQPANHAKATSVPGRRVLQGGALELADVTRTDAAGVFVLETSHFGRGVLAVDGDDAAALQVTATAGERTRGLECRR